MGSGLALCIGCNIKNCPGILQQEWLHNEVGYIKIHNIEAVGSGHQFPKVDVRWEL